ncbi:MAG: Plug domain-containing protein, partial [Parafilimonas sp.]
MIPALVLHGIVPCVATLVLYIFMAALRFHFKISFRFLKAFLFLLFYFFIFNSAKAQTDSLKNFNDTTTLETVTVTAFGSNTNWKNTPAVVAIINKNQLQRFDNKTLVPVLNTVAGVRMEERSPGSYRLSIRGSLLRSPFGVRNIKIYWNDIPLTDAGG